MRNSKKITALILCLVLLASGGLTALAAGPTQPPPPPSQPPSGQNQTQPTPLPTAQPTGTPKPSAQPTQKPSEQPKATSGDTPSEWAKAEVKAAIDAGLVPEKLQSFYTRNITRIEFCTLAVNLYEYLKGTEITGRIRFTDTNDVNAEKAASIGFVSGYGDNLFDPNAPITREQAATMLSRLAEAAGGQLAKKDPSFSDNASISTWAFGYVGQVQAVGIMSGTGNNNFSPKDSYTREQSIATILRTLNAVTPLLPAKPAVKAPDTVTEQRYTFSGNDFMKGLSGLYTGEMKDGKPHGRGALVFDKGNPFNLLRYYGDWENGVMKGQGTAFWGNGDSFSGAYDKNNKNGAGVYTYADGTVMEGTWRNDMEHGAFVITLPDGTVFDVVFNNGEMTEYKER